MQALYKPAQTCKVPIALSAIVEEIVEGGEATVTYVNDGSAVSGVGSYVVQISRSEWCAVCILTFSIYFQNLKNP